MDLERISTRGTGRRVAVSEAFEANTPEEREYRDFLRSVEQEALANAEMLVGRDYAEDVLQDVAVHIYRKWAELPPEKHTKAFFLTSITNRALTYKRREKRYEELPAVVDELPGLQVPAPDPFTGELRAIDVIEPVLKTVPEQRRFVWVMRIQGWSNEQIAAKLDIDVQVVRKYMRIATAEVEKGLEQNGVELSFESLLTLLPARTSEDTDE
jgi:RNA polymerase sigma factor (sigma-70 family)